MAFNSYQFAAFLLLAVVAYWNLCRSLKAKNALLLGLSYFFYCCWDYRFLSLILISTFVDFYAGKKIHQTGEKKWLWFSLITNLGILGFFKYFNFFVGSAVDLLNQIGFTVDHSTLNIILPVGISFYTFQTLSYSIDIYRKKAEPATNLLDFATYVSFFPQLVAGPIERPSQLLVQIENDRTFQTDHLFEGFHHILLGLFKKVVIADNMAPIVNGIFAPGAETLSGPENWLGLIAFALQIYCDFSGYSSIAQGSALLLGIRLSYNFHMPYFAASPSEFWKRWHVTLSQWLRDYVYIPLGGNRSGKFNEYRNLMLTMAIGGLWHGAGWNFVLWGIFHGLILCVYRFLAELFPGKGSPTNVASKLMYVAAVLVMFMLTLIGWLFFRIENVSQIFSVLASLFTSFGWSALCSYATKMILLVAGPLLVYEFFVYRRNDDHLMAFRWHWLLRGLLYLYFAVMMILFSTEGSYEFIYFQF